MLTTLTTQPYFLKFSKFLSEKGVDMIRIALAIVFIWFGGLKVIGMSPAQELVEKTIYWFPPAIFIPFLGWWEVAIGMGMLFKKLIPVTLILLLFHMAGTFLPLIILPDLCFDQVPWCPSMEGQYIIKNLVLISGALTVGGKYNMQQYKNL